MDQHLLMLLVQFIHWGSPQCLFHFVQGFDVCEMEIKHLFVKILFCYDFKELIVIPTVNN